MKYSDFYLIPRKSIVSSRSECDTSIVFGGHTFNLPVVPANMDTVIDIDLAVRLAKRGYFYILHRFMAYPDIVDFVTYMRNQNLVSSISVGVQPKDYTLVDKLAGSGLDYITVDVAHVHSTLGARMVKYIKVKLPGTFLIAGNIGSQAAVDDLTKWGADAIKLCVGSGSICNTTPNTGFHGSPVDLLMSLQSELPLIVDGGATEHGDIAKALTLGATMLMSGSFFSNATESPAPSVMVDGVECKIYAGSTAYNETHKEGRVENVAVNGSIWSMFDTMTQNLQSAISYAGGRDLSAFGQVDIKEY